MPEQYLPADLGHLFPNPCLLTALDNLLISFEISAVETT
jgi:hypothetical protein